MSNPGTPSLSGYHDAHFHQVHEFLADEFTFHGAVGAAIALIVDGRLMVDLWGGHKDEARNRPWEHDTLVCLFSAGKPLAAVAVLMLVDQGKLALDAPVAHYWPEFAKAGKSGVTVRQALAHLAGVPIAAAAPPRSVYDRSVLVEALQDQEPVWPPGTQGCFHSFTYGILAGEIVRRVDGRPFPYFFREEIAKPLGLDLAFSLTAEEQARCADVIIVEDNPLLGMMRDPSTLLGRSWRPLPWDELNSPAFRGCDFPSLAGHGSALGLARFYGMMASNGAIGDSRLLTRATTEAALREQWHHMDPFFGAPLRMGLGFTLANDLLPFTGNQWSFAQPGLGGTVGLGDAEAKLGLGITVNRLAAGIDNRRLQELIGIIMRRL